MFLWNRNRVSEISGAFQESESVLESRIGNIWSFSESESVSESEEVELISDLATDSSQLLGRLLKVRYNNIKSID